MRASVFRNVVGGSLNKIIKGFFDPSLLNPLAWWDATDASTITLSGSNVTQWDDKSGNGYNFAQATGASQPLLESGGIRFTEDFMTAAGSNLANVDFDLFMVVSIGQNMQGKRIFGTSGQSGTESLYVRNTGTNNWQGGSATNRIEFNFGFNIEYNQDEVFILEIDHKSSAAVFKNNQDLPIATDNFSQFTVDNNYLVGSAFDSNSRVQNAVIKEILITPTLTEQQRTEVTQYLAFKHGVAI